MTIAYISHPACLLHEMGPGHPESPQRLQAIETAIAAAEVEPRLCRYEALKAERSALERVHSPDHVGRVFENAAVAAAEGLVWLDPDTAMNPHTLEAALRAAGAGIMAVDLLQEGRHRRAFCAVRPPGHHAERTRSMGFCFFNNVAVAAAYAMARHGLERVAILDFDVHHGNGTEDIFGGDGRVLFCSTFQHPFYPFRGSGSHPSHVVTVPLGAGSGGREFHRAVRDHWLPALERHRPELIFISAGFDAHRDDFLAGLNLVEEDYRQVTRTIADAAGSVCGGRVIAFLEGGYNLDALGRSVVAHLEALG